MTRTERLQFIDEQLKGLWPGWTPTDAELGVWIGILGRMDYALARDALHHTYCTRAGNYQRPKPAPFLAEVQRRRLQRSEGSPPTREVTTTVFVVCTVAPPGHPNRVGQRLGVYVAPVGRQRDVDYVRSCAESMRRHCERLYGGTWITVVEPGNL